MPRCLMLFCVRKLFAADTLNIPFCALPTATALRIGRSAALRDGVRSLGSLAGDRKVLVVSILMVTAVAWLALWR